MQAFSIVMNNERNNHNISNKKCGELFDNRAFWLSLEKDFNLNGFHNE